MAWSDFFNRNFSVSIPDYDDDYSQNIARNDEDPKIANDQRHVQEYRKSHQHCKELRRMLEESTKQRQHLERQLDLHKNRVHDLQETLDSCKKEASVSRKGQLCAEERFRRQTEILKERSAALDSSLEENSSLLIQQATLQRWTNHLDDDEARHMMTQLYQDLEGWARRYFPGLLPGYKALNVNPDSLLMDENHRLDKFYGIYDLVSCAVFRVFLTRVMVGINDSDFGDKVSMLDRHIRAECPTHVAQHWRSAMNIATSSLSRDDQDSECKRLAVLLEPSYDCYSSGDPDRRITNLQNLLARFVGLKFRLDLQADLYKLTWKESGNVFNAEEMTSFTGQCPENGVVQYCLSPALYKESKESGPIVIKKAIVILFMDLQPSSGGYDSDENASAHEAKMTES